MHEGKRRYICVRFGFGKTEGKKPIRTSRRRREDNIKMNLKEIAFKDMDFVCLAQALAQWRSLNDKKRNHRSP